MSFDLVLFDPDAAPKSRREFLKWFSGPCQVDEGHSYSDHAVCTPILQAFYLELIESFPPMDGPLAPEDFAETGNSRVTDYSLGKNHIHACFAWSVAEDAYKITKEVAARHGVGFYNISSDAGEVIIPGAEIEKKPWWRFW